MALAQSLWDNRYVLFKAEERMSKEEKQPLSRIVEADRKGSLNGWVAPAPSP